MYKEMWIELKNRLDDERNLIYDVQGRLYKLALSRCLEYMNEIDNKRMAKSLEEAGYF